MTVVQPWSYPTAQALAGEVAATAYKDENWLATRVQVVPSQCKIRDFS
jgi:hypothetical protein